MSRSAPIPAESPPDPWGIEHTYEDALRQTRRVPHHTIDTLRRVIGEPRPGGPVVVRSGTPAAVGRCNLVLEDGTQLEVDSRLPPDIPLGYHRLEGENETRMLIVSPGLCHLPTGRIWGWAVQLYSTRSQHSWGMGDLGDLSVLAGWSRRLGAEMMLVNPLMAVAPASPRQPSPYYPTSRLFLDPIYLRLEDIPGSELIGEDLAAAAAAGRALNQDPMVRRDEVWRLKSEMLERLWHIVPRGAFLEWRSSQGSELEVFATYCTLAERHGGDWRQWPTRLQHPHSPAVAEAHADHEDRVEYHEWLQWHCSRQLAEAGADLRLVQDLPIGFDPGGADAWVWQDVLAQGVSVGAPPDEFNTRGQIWGLPPFIPHRLREIDYRPFIQTIRSAMARHGGLRIDHVMGLSRLFWVPDGSPPSDGAYVRYPRSDLLDIIALESHRARSLVVGEDLGTVETGLREDLIARNILSYRLLWFEEDEPCSWPELSMASITTHDLPTVMGLWTGADLEEQHSLGLEPNVESTKRIRSSVAALDGVDEHSSPGVVVTAVHERLAQA
ncbi:MAG: 4-alpha-glucanotransferase, partial [Acidimicrobiia bacterium]